MLRQKSKLATALSMVLFVLFAAGVAVVLWAVLAG